MHFTLREFQRLKTPFLIWIALTSVATIAGPFGTLDVLGVVGRALYWGAIVGSSIGLGFAASVLSERFERIGVLAIWCTFVLLLSIMVQFINGLVFEGMQGWMNWLYLFWIVGVVTAAVQLVIRGIPSAAESEVADKDTFMLRLPLELRGPLVRIEAQDHYLNVVTSRGNALILMRLSDATDELASRGVQVHRSHWIAPESVKQHRRDKGRDVLVMSDGTDVPVSRSFRENAQSAGLF